jgi:hypothetical protein
MSTSDERRSWAYLGRVRRRTRTQSAVALCGQATAIVGDAGDVHGDLAGRDTAVDAQLLARPGIRLKGDRVYQRRTVVPGQQVDGGRQPRRDELDPVFRKLWEGGAKDELPRAEAWLREAAPAITARLGQPG